MSNGRYQEEPDQDEKQSKRDYDFDNSDILRELKQDRDEQNKKTYRELRNEKFELIIKSI